MKWKCKTYFLCLNFGGFCLNISCALPLSKLLSLINYLNPCFISNLTYLFVTDDGRKIGLQPIADNIASCSSEKPLWFTPRPSLLDAFLWTDLDSRSLLSFWNNSDFYLPFGTFPCAEALEVLVAELCSDATKAFKLSDTAPYEEVPKPSFDRLFWYIFNTKGTFLNSSNFGYVVSISLFIFSATDSLSFWI